MQNRWENRLGNINIFAEIAEGKVYVVNIGYNSVINIVKKNYKRNTLLNIRLLQK